MKLIRNRRIIINQNGEVGCLRNRNINWLMSFPQRSFTVRRWHHKYNMAFGKCFIFIIWIRINNFTFLTWGQSFFLYNFRYLEFSWRKLILKQLKDKNKYIFTIKNGKPENNNYISKCVVIYAYVKSWLIYIL